MKEMDPNGIPQHATGAKLDQGKQYCLKCGLIALNNEATYRAIRGACKGDQNG